MKINITIIIILFLLFACAKEYERNNPFDPDYTGIRTRIINIHNVYVEEMDGNLDNIINKGEKIRLYISLINTGNSQVGNVKANIDINKSDIVVDDFDSNLEWGNIPSGSISSGKGGINVSEADARVTFSIDNGVLIDDTFTINFDFYDDLSNHWQDSLSYVINETNALLVLDTLSLLESSDISYRYFEFHQKIKNIGSSSTQDVWSISSTQDDSVQLVFYGDDPISYSDIDAGESKSPEFPFPEFRIIKSLSTPYTFKMKFEIHDTYDNYWYDSTFVVIN